MPLLQRIKGFSLPESVTAAIGHGKARETPTLESRFLRSRDSQKGQGESPGLRRVLLIAGRWRRHSRSARGGSAHPWRSCSEEAEFRYRDDGPGLALDLELSQVGSSGLKRVYNLAVRLLRETMELVHDPRTEFVFRFRDIDIMKRM